MDDDKKAAADYASGITGVVDPKSNRWQVPYRAFLAGVEWHREKYKAAERETLRSTPLINRDQEAQT